jgi:hypothetical protein
VGDIIGKSVVNMECDDYRAARKMLTGTFNVPNSRKLIPVFQKRDARSAICLTAQSRPRKI